MVNLRVEGHYTGYAGWAVTAGIPVKFGTAHDRLRPEVGSTKSKWFSGSLLFVVLLDFYNPTLIMSLD